MSRPGSDSTLPLGIAFLLAIAFLGVVVAIGLNDGPDGGPVAQAQGTTTFPGDLPEVIPQVRLTLDTAGEGKGTVRVAGESRVCSAECSFKMDRETSVTIIARARPGSKFVTWTGQCGGGRICTIYMDRSRSVTALFTRPQESLPLPEATPDCTDGADNDADGFADDADPECFSGKTEAGDGTDPLQGLDDPALDDPTPPPPPLAPPPVVPPPVIPPPVVPPPVVPPPPPDVIPE